MAPPVFSLTKRQRAYRSARVCLQLEGPVLRLHIAD
ncbi:hypothetical protein chiPu_0022330, partial [Chiloscyllium punctatum]|nr:hypothetical protein [Chiloscyllium punctatum]